MFDMALPLQNKTILVTGATAGIGEVAAQSLAQMGASLILVSRNPERCQAAAERIRKKLPAGADPARVEWIAADLSTQADILRVVNEFTRRHDRLDVLLNNAGGIFLNRQLNPEGIEMTLALNHLAYFRLSTRLLEKLKATAAAHGEARIVNVSSAAHQGQRLNFDDLQNEHGYKGFQVYGQSKLMNLYFTYELARRLEGTGVTVNALHPGFVGTSFAMNNGFLVALVMRLIRFTARTPQQGAESSIYLAASPEVRGVTGKYFLDCKAVASDPASYNEADARQLWEVSEKLSPDFTS